MVYLTPAFADPNVEPMVVVGITHELGADAPWGAELGAHANTLLGDPCGFDERSCRDGQGWWPTAGPRVALTWRGAARFGLTAEGTLGVESVDVFDAGFFSAASVRGAIGPRAGGARRQRSTALGARGRAGAVLARFGPDHHLHLVLAAMRRTCVSLALGS